MKILIKLLLSSSLLYLSSLAFACDNKSCEIAYLNNSMQYIDLQNTRAFAARQERIAYAKIREERQKQINKQLIREARANLIRIINKAIAQGKSVKFIEAAIKEAQESGAIKAKINLQTGERNTTEVILPKIKQNSSRIKAEL